MVYLRTGRYGPVLVRGELTAVQRAGRAAAHARWSGSPTWTRTRDLLINSQLLYQLSYRGAAVAAGR